MVDRGKSSTVGKFDRLVCEEDDDCVSANQEIHEVSLSMEKPESRFSRYTVIAASLAVVALILLATDIGLVVYYNTLTSGQRRVVNMNSELTKLQAKYNTIIQNRDDAKRQLDKEIIEQQRSRWELLHQSRRRIDYQKQIDKIQMDIAVYKSQLPMIEEGCRRCLAGWNFKDSRCYYFAFTLSTRQWSDARQFCKLHGGDLVVIDSAEKNEVIHNLIMHHTDASQAMHLNGFWIGLTDTEVENDWKWVTGRRLTEGYWNDDEPNDYMGNEDCAATYPRGNPFQAWNDAPCSYLLRWICEMEPRAAS